MTTPTTQIDVLSELAGVRPGSPLAELRGQRPEATLRAQGSYAALFDADETGGLSQFERLATALRVANLHSASATAAHFRARLARSGAGQRIIAEAEARAEHHAPSGPDLDLIISPRLRAILRHADLLSRQPARATPQDLQALADAGLSTREIVSLSQVIAFTSFFVRVLAGLQLLGAEPPQDPAALPDRAVPRNRARLRLARRRPRSSARTRT